MFGLENEVCDDLLLFDADSLAPLSGYPMLQQLFLIVLF